jgi:serine protease Do
MILVLVVLGTNGAARADESFAGVTDEVNSRLVKVFGAGGYRGVPSYGTGIIVAPDGHILTVASQMLESEDLRLHLPNGDRYHARIVAAEPELDLALLKIKEKVDGLKYFNIAEEIAKPMPEPGTGVLAFSNTFNIASRAEPMSVQQGVIAARSKLRGRRGVFEAPYDGEVYFVDAITNNPGGAGGALTTRDGKQLLGIIGKELKNTLTETWINFALPLQARVEVKTEKETRVISVADFVERGLKGQYTVVIRKKEKTTGKGGYHGIVLVPNVVERTPPYVEELLPGSPAAQAGLRPDDLIVYVEGEQVVCIKDFREIMDRYPPGSALKVEVRRGDKLTTLNMKVEEQPRKK